MAALSLPLTHISEKALAVWLAGLLAGFLAGSLVMGGLADGLVGGLVGISVRACGFRAVQHLCANFMRDKVKKKTAQVHGVEKFNQHLSDRYRTSSVLQAARSSRVKANIAHEKSASANVPNTSQNSGEQCARAVLNTIDAHRSVSCEGLEAGNPQTRAVWEAGSPQTRAESGHLQGAISDDALVDMVE